MQPRDQPTGSVGISDVSSVESSLITDLYVPLLIATGGSTPMFCLQGVPDVPREPPDEAGLMRKFEK